MALLVLSAFSPTSAAEAPVPGDAAGARWLAQEGRYEEAKAVLTKLLVTNPKDAGAQFYYAYTLFLQATAERDPKTATALRKSSYAEGVKAQKLGSTDPLLDLLFRHVDQDGRDLADPKNFSANPEAAALIKQGEQAFSARKMDEALSFYRQAYALDAHSHVAALFVGDVYFTQRDYPQAIEWFEKATVIAPNVELAYRYWGDALLKLDKVDEARARYIDAVIAEPYNRLPRTMIANFAKARGLALGRPSIALPQIEVTVTDGKPQLGIPPDGDPIVLGYAIARAQWLTEERAKYFSASDPARHSLREECHGLRMLIDLAGELDQTSAEIVKPYKDSLKLLKSLNDDGLLEAFVLLDRPDKGIAGDYAAYRVANREKLVRYISERWIPAPGQARR